MHQLSDIVVGAYSASPFNSRGTSPESPAACRMNRSFSGGTRSTTPSPMSRTVRNSVDLFENRKFSELVANAHRHGVEPPPALIALDHIELAEVAAEPRRVDHHFGQRRDVLRPMLRPWPAIGWITCAASPTSASRSPINERATK